MTQPPYPGTTPVTPPPAPHAPPAPPGNSPPAPPVSPPPTPPIVPAPTRPLLRSSRTIQGNVLAAFNKDHQAFRMVTLPADPSRARAWLAGLLGQICVTEDVEDWNETFSEARRANGGVDDPNLHVVWVGLTLTAAGLAVLAQDPGRVATDLATMPALTAGPAARAAALGDVGPSDPATWLFGGPSQAPVHAVVTVAADLPAHLAERELLLDTHDATHGVTTAFRQEGDTLPGPLAGHEHFGFKDGISQPGVTNFHEAGPRGERAGHPGTTMAPASDFILGQPGGPQVPAWLRDGSAHVLRRLEQDVPAWRAQLDALAATITGPPGPVTPERLGELLMGRSQDGTPLATPTDPTRGLGDDGNDFDYANDPTGQTTPCAAHIRKTHPRSFSPAPRMMRRGIPFGAPLDLDPTGKRGLVFNCFVTSIDGQFEFIQQSWANSPGFSGGGGPTGPDPVIGSDGQLTIAIADGTHCTLSIARAVHTTGGVYGLTLSLPTLRALAADGQLTA